MKIITLLIASILLISAVLVIDTSAQNPPTLIVSSPQDNAVYSDRYVYLNYTVSDATKVYYTIEPSNNNYTLPYNAYQPINLSGNTEITAYPGYNKLTVYAENAEGTTSETIYFRCNLTTIKIVVLADQHMCYNSSSGIGWYDAYVTQALSSIYNLTGGWDFLIGIGDNVDYSEWYGAHDDGWPGLWNPDTFKRWQDIFDYDTEDYFDTVSICPSLVPGRVIPIPGNHEYDGTADTAGTFHPENTLYNYTNFHFKHFVNETVDYPGSDQYHGIRIKIGNILLLSPLPDFNGTVYEGRTTIPNNQTRFADYGNAANWFNETIHQYASSNMFVFTHVGIIDTVAGTVRTTATSGVPSDRIQASSVPPHVTNSPDECPFVQALNQVHVDAWFSGHIHTIGTQHIEKYNGCDHFLTGGMPFHVDGNPSTSYVGYIINLTNGSNIADITFIEYNSGSVSYDNHYTITLNRQIDFGLKLIKRPILRGIKDFQSQTINITDPTFIWDWGSIRSPISYKLLVYSTDSSFNYTVENISHSEFLVDDHIEYRWGSKGEPSLEWNKEYRWRVKCVYMS